MKNGQKSSLYGETSLYSEEIPYSELFSKIHYIEYPLCLFVDIVKVDALLVPENPKRHFFRDIGNSFHEVTQISLEPHQIFSF